MDRWKGQLVSWSRLLLSKKHHLLKTILPDFCQWRRWRSAGQIWNELKSMTSRNLGKFAPPAGNAEQSNAPVGAVVIVGCVASLARSQCWGSQAERGVKNLSLLRLVIWLEVALTKIPWLTKSRVEASNISI